MGLDWKTAAMAFGTGVMEGDEKIRKEMALKAIDTSMGLTISKRAENILKFINDKVKQ